MGVLTAFINLFLRVLINQVSHKKKKKIQILDPI